MERSEHRKCYQRRQLSQMMEETNRGVIFGTKQSFHFPWWPVLPVATDDILCCEVNETLQTVDTGWTLDMATLCKVSTSVYLGLILQYLKTAITIVYWVFTESITAPPTRQKRAAHWSDTGLTLATVTRYQVQTQQTCHLSHPRCEF